MNKYLKYNVSSIILLILIAFMGYKYGSKDLIKWEKNIITWNDFVKIDSISGGYHAEIFSGIKIKGHFKKNNFEVYSYMDPNESSRVVDSSYNQLLKHEMYHFNIAEYHARLFRKEVISIGVNLMTQKKLNSLHNKYNRLTIEMHDKYDDESDHNKKIERQRFWELKIDDLLRQTEILKTQIFTLIVIIKRKKHNISKVFFLLSIMKY